MINAPGKLLKVKDRLLHVRIDGSGPPTVVLEAGLGCGAETWCAIFDDVSRMCTVVAYDRNGLMYSERGSNQSCRDTWLSDLQDILSAPDIPKPVIFVGHSLGGVIARHYIADHPDQVEGLILIESPDKEHLEDAEIVKQFQSSLRIAQYTGCLGSICQYLATFSYQIFKPFFNGMARFRYRKYTRKHGREIINAVLHNPIRTLLSASEEAQQARSLISTMPNFRYIDDINLIVIAAETLQKTHPVSIAGSTMQLRPATRHFRIQENIVKRLGKGRFVVAKDSGHVVPLQRPDLVLDEISDLVIRYQKRLGLGDNIE